MPGLSSTSHGWTSQALPPDFQDTLSATRDEGREIAVNFFRSRCGDGSGDEPGSHSTLW